MILREILQQLGGAFTFGKFFRKDKRGAVQSGELNWFNPVTDSWRFALSGNF